MLSMNNIFGGSKWKWRL